MDDFERRLSVALKTASNDLPPAGAVIAETVRVHPEPPVRHRSSRAVLVVAVLVLLAVVAGGGGWWAVTRGERATPATPLGPCTGRDVSLAHETPAGDTATREILVVTANAACTLDAAPTVTVGGQAVPDEDTGRWVPQRLDVGMSIRFAVSAIASGLPCPGRTPTAAASAQVGTDGTPVTFDVPGGACFKGYVVRPFGPQPVSTACRTDDVAFARADPPIGLTDVLAVTTLTARSACTLIAPPALTVNGSAVPWAATPGDTVERTPWSPVALQRGATVEFSLVRLLVPGAPPPGCASSPALETAVGLPGAEPLLRFEIASGSGCATLAFTTLRGPATDTTTATDDRCSADDLTATLWSAGVAGGGPIGVVLRATTACTLDAPPSLTLAPVGEPGFAVPFAGAQPSDDTPWLPEALTPGDEARFSVASQVGKGICPDSDPVAVRLVFAIDGTPVASSSWAPSPGCGLNILRLVTGLR